MFGLSGSGKTTFAQKLKTLIPESEHINADEVREKFNDWDFSPEGRERQAYRMKRLADESSAKLVILDFICPLDNYRNMINADMSFYIDRVDNGKYLNTNNIFEVPDKETVFVIK